MRNVTTLLCIAGFIALAASTDEKPVDEVYDNGNEGDILREEGSLGSVDEEDAGEETDEYFLEKLFNRGKEAAGRDGKRTGSGRGSDFFKRFFQKRNGSRGRDGGGRGGRRPGGDFFTKFMGKKMGGENGSTDAEGSPKGRDFLKKLMENKMVSGRGDESSGGSDFLKKYLDGKSPASYGVEDEEAHGKDERYFLTKVCDDDKSDDDDFWREFCDELRNEQLD